MEGDGLRLDESHGNDVKQARFDSVRILPLSCGYLMTWTAADGTYPAIRINFDARNAPSTVFAGICQTHQFFDRCHVAPPNPPRLDASMVMELPNSGQ